MWTSENFNCFLPSSLFGDGDKQRIMEKKKITLGICTNRLIQPRTLECLLNLVNKSKHDLEICAATRGYTVAENRNYCVIQAQKNGSDYILFIDDDMTLPPETLDILLSHKKDIVGVNSYSRILPLAPTTGLINEKGEYKHPDKYPEWEMRIPDELFEAYFVGCGVCLIDMKVFKKVKNPFFKFTYKKSGLVKGGEDGNFCDRARKLGFKVFCDPNISIGHLGIIEFSEDLDIKLKELYK
jgi:glycosyltransferase involved in cell wall biosynthesis